MDNNKGFGSKTQANENISRVETTSSSTNESHINWHHVLKILAKIAMWVAIIFVVLGIISFIVSTVIAIISWLFSAAVVIGVLWLAWSLFFSNKSMQKQNDWFDRQIDQYKNPTNTYFGGASHSQEKKDYTFSERVRDSHGGYTTVTTNARTGRSTDPYGHTGDVRDREFHD